MATDGEHYLINTIFKQFSICYLVVLNNRTYYFEYKWNIREQKGIFSYLYFNK